MKELALAKNLAEIGACVARAISDSLARVD